MGIEFYEYPASPYCRSVKLIASIINVPLEIKTVNLLEKEQLAPEYLEKNPSHQVPTINDNGYYLSESRAIATYLVDKYAPDHTLYPKEIQKRSKIDQMLYFDSGTLAPSISPIVRPIVYENRIPGEADHEKAKDVLKTLDLILSKNKYVAGSQLTIADIAIRATFSITEVLGSLDTSKFLNVTDWAKRVRTETEPAYGEINDKATEFFGNFLKNKIAELSTK